MALLDGTRKLDFMRTYADLMRERVGQSTQCTPCGDALPDGANMKAHWGSCCNSELMEADQGLASVSRASKKRMGVPAGQATTVSAMFANAPTTLRSRIGLRGIMLMYVCLARTAFNAANSAAMKFLVENLGGTALANEMVSVRTLLRDLPLLAGAAAKAVRENRVFSLHAKPDFKPSDSIPICFSATMDAWTNRRQKAFASVTVHFVTPEMKKVSRWLGFESFPHPHTANVITGLLDAVLDRKRGAGWGGRARGVGRAAASRHT